MLTLHWKVRSIFEPPGSSITESTTALSARAGTDLERFERVSGLLRNFSSTALSPKICQWAAMRDTEVVEKVGGLGLSYGCNG